MSEDVGPTETFDFDASTRQAWKLFTERLAEVVSVIDDGASLRVGTLTTETEPAPFVSFTCGARPSRDEPPMILAEAASNAVLGDGFQLGAAQLDQLAALGWQSPSVEEPHPTPNFWAEHVQDDCHWLAELAVNTLRDVFGVQHPVFLAPDQLAEILATEPAVRERPGGSEAHAGQPGEAHDFVATMPADHAQLREFVRTELAHMFGHEPISDEEGDFTIRVGSSMVFVRCTSDAREVLLFSALVHDLEGRGRAIEVLNDLNSESRFGRFALYRDRVFVSMSLLTRPFVPSHLHEGVRIITQIADGIDDELAAKLRGRVTFTDEEER
ncbi:MULTISPECIES: T3SS (YopN, CesT) and YbjN peptide-binding chaperone 1 [unclassified Luteococcus]|uniref:T3SS (YopN, CesT) and YbjN peptide-binding chaperone 1 n=1 Tax=unclassified Luteococcus TaxID=2639923 RepID=UPI00313C3BED